MSKNIYLEPDEEIISVIDRLVQTDVRKVNMVIPTGARIWQSSINLKLLKREADNLGKDVSLVVADDLNSEMAEKIGFNVKQEGDFSAELAIHKNENQPKEKEDMIDFLAEGLESDKKSSKSFSSFLSKQKVKPNKKKSSGKTAANLTQKAEKRMVDIVNPEGDVKVNFFRRKIIKSEPIPRKKIISGLAKKEAVFREKVSQVSSVHSIEGTSAFSKWPKFFTIFVALAFVAAIAVGCIVLPTTEITVFPKREKVNFDLLVIGSKSLSHIDEELNKIPLKEISIKKTKSGEFSATDEKELNKKATGIITIYNEYSSDAQPLVVRTRFESPDGRIFRIVEAVTVPGAKIEDGKIIPSALEVRVAADKSGADYNIGPTNFTIPGFKGSSKFAGFYGKSENSMEGGIIGKAKVVSAEDIKNAEKQLVEELKNAVKITLQEQIPSDLKIIEESLREETSIVSSTAEEGDQSEKFTLEMEANIFVYLFNEEELRRLVDFNLISMISGDKTPLSNSQQISWSELLVDWDKGEVSFSLSVEEDLASNVDVQSLKTDLAGLREVEVRKYLANQPTIETARVSFWPFWIKKIPTRLEKIEITIDDYAEEY